jgi:hypothetical protein
MKKAVPFHWEEDQTKAFETLKTKMCTQPVLRQPDNSKPFFLSTDASAYDVGAVLSQKGELNPRTKKPTQHPIAYYSSTFTPTERNYDIYELELLAIIKSLHHWHPHLARTEEPVTVLTDHANLTYWKELRKVNCRLARWFGELQDYNLCIQHVPGKTHTAPDMLSRPPGTDLGRNDNQDVTLLRDELFVRVFESNEDPPELMDILNRLEDSQKKHKDLMKLWAEQHRIVFYHEVAHHLNTQFWLKDRKRAVPPDDDL